MTDILQFIATGTISTSTGRFDYTYGSYFYYQLGFKAKAIVLDWANWALKDRLAYAPDLRKYTIYRSSGSIDLQGNRKRMSYANDTLAETALLDLMYLFKRQDDDSMDLDPQMPQSTQQIQCPAGDNSSLKLLGLRWMMNYMTQNVGKMDPETDPDDRDDLLIGWFQGSNTDFDGVTQGWSSYEKNRLVPVGYDPVNWSGQPADKSWTFKRNYTLSVIDDGSQASNWWDAIGKQFTTNTGYTFCNPNGYSSVICAVNIFDQDDYYQNSRQSNAAEFNGPCYRSDSYAANGWPGYYWYSRCKVDFGAAVTKRSEGDAAIEKDEWEITGVMMLDDDFAVGEDVDWDLLAKQDAGQKTEASISEAETPLVSAKDSPSDSSVLVSLPTLDAIPFPLDKA
ncbi:hypothetical protein GQ607_015887 [Colletotrichum asianum]|uniref:Uncharacterized protein n=1 Tax=Colletotrichum asianum TaxID=702518 RepID=A0A8H3VZ39_9PEZI|nr:hypothetical protein GQ607_015887 [Colletotrichum asianum]